MPESVPHQTSSDWADHAPELDLASHAPEVDRDKVSEDLQVAYPITALANDGFFHLTGQDAPELRRDIYQTDVNQATEYGKEGKSHHNQTVSDGRKSSKKKRLYILSVLVFLCVAGLAVGLGVGLRTRNAQGDSK